MSLLPWNELAISPADVSVVKTLPQWAWIVAPMQPVTISAFGDWFLADERGEIHWLDILEGRVTRIAESQSEFLRLRECEEKRDEWFLEGLVWRLRENGTRLPPDSCYGFNLHPLLGGKINADNVGVFGFVVWQTISAQLVRQVRESAPGTHVGQITVDGQEP